MLKFTRDNGNEKIIRFGIVQVKEFLLLFFVPVKYNYLYTGRGFLKRGASLTS
jgi:hypothetical protein